ncbi:MAG: P-loop NTPase fold protein [Acholeplasmataceae bacterium]|nr:P-loop NTPase fold protein [Acholeplasmataceae bacterium]
MKSKDLSNVLDSFVISNHRSILFDGPWGCGKTYQIREYISKISKGSSKVYYISLFGKETIDEVNTELYRTVHPNLFKTKKIASTGLNLISKAVSPIPVVGSTSGIVDALGFALNDISDKGISGNKIIVFDDLERIDKKLSYIAMLGYFNSLFLSQIRIVCLCSSKNIDLEKQDGFNDFKEKIFDKMHVIDESDEEIISSYFSHHKIENMHTIISDFDNNLRLAQKTASFFNEIVKYASDNHYNLPEKISNFQLVRSCNQAIKICYYQHKKPEFSSKNSDNSDAIKKVSYEQDVKAVGENIANGLHYLLRKKTGIIDPTVQTYSENVIKGLIDILLFNNYTLFDNTFKPKPNTVSDNDFLSNEVFFLSDENKFKYVSEFLDKLFIGSIYFDSVNTYRFADILRYTSFEFSNEDIDKVIFLMFEQSNKLSYGELDVASSVVRIIHSVPGINNRPRLKQWIDKIDEKRKDYITQSKLKALETSYKSKKFIDMDKFVDELLNSVYTRDNEDIIKYIVNHEFLLPDLSGNLSHSAWSYAHEMANYSRHINREKEFIEVAIENCAKQPSNKSLFDRYDALIRSKIDSEFNLRDAVNNRLN